VKRLLGWLVCWDRPWAAREAMFAAMYGRVFCPCPKHQGRELPQRVAHLQHLVDSHPEAFEAPKP
jgi:hypothetical protein